MDRRVYFLMALHCHQPVGNFGFVFEEAFRKAYEPFLSVLERHPGVHVALHYSGSLLDWLAESQPRFLDRVRGLVQRGQVELLASGYYEPILPLLPEWDRQGQIGLMRQALRKRFGVEATGLWLTERVWEPDLPTTLARAGIRYALVDTNQFRVAERVLPSSLQVQDEHGRDLLGCFVTEHAGESVTLFPTSKRLRYWIPFQDVARTIEFLKRVAREHPVAITYADDGEKFGLWPKTYAWVYEQGWLEQFCTALERESAWLKTTTCSRYLQEIGPSGRVYLPCGSYDEMLEWSGGTFRNFFVKYPEANAMQQKMLQVSRQLQQSAVPARPGKRGAGGSSQQSAKKKRDKPSKRQQPSKRAAQLLAKAQHELYKAQCNDAYWHGVFGGLYLSHLRRAVYSHLITAERMLQDLATPRNGRQHVDLDGDGRTEVVLRNRYVSLVVDPDEDGTVTELDLYPRALNLVDTLARRYEPYHETLTAKQTASVSASGETPASIHQFLKAKEEGLEGYLAYDDHRRSCFIDSALSAMPTLQEIQRSTWGEYRLWSAGPWQLVQPHRRAASSEGAVVGLNRQIQDGSLHKTIALSRSAPRVSFRYQLKDLAIPVVGLEWNVCLRDARLREPSWQERVSRVQIDDETLQVRLTVTIDPPASLATFPIETVSESEQGLERTPQGLAFVWLWPTDGQSAWGCRLDWTIEDR